jgi:hypothetical protein
VEVWLYAFLTSALGSGKWSASRLGVFTLGERAPISTGKEAVWTTGHCEEDGIPLQDNNIIVSTQIV